MTEKEKNEMEKDILFQIDMQLYDEFNDTIATMNDHLGDIYSLKDVEEVEKAEKEKEIKLLREAVKKLQADIEIKDKVIDLIIDDFQTEGYFKKMTYEQVKKYYDNRNELKQEINTLPLNLDLTAK